MSPYHHHIGVFLFSAGPEEAHMVFFAAVLFKSQERIHYDGKLLWVVHYLENELIFL